MKSSLISFPAAVVLALLLSACSKEETAEAGETANHKAVLISTHQADVMDLPIWLETVGRLHSRSTPTLAAEIEGRITMVAADTGNSIEQGQLLAETDTSSLLLQQQAAQAVLERLEVHIANGVRRVDRFEKLSSKNLSSQTEFDDSREQLEAYRADYKAAQAQLAIVKDSLAKSRIIAPVSGVIQQRLIATGDFVKRGQAVFEITRPNLLQARLPYPEMLALRIHIGQPAKIYSPLTPGEFVSGEITELQPSIGLGSRAVMVIVDLDDPGNLRPDATLSGKVLVETRNKAVMVPAISVVRRPAGEVVYVSGLDGGETIATDGAAFLSDGADVKVMEDLN